MEANNEKRSKMIEVKKFNDKILSIKNPLTKEEESSFSAGFEDIIRGIEKIKILMQDIINTESKDQISDLLFDIHFELVNHIKSHIESIDKPLLKLSEEISD